MTECLHRHEYDSESQGPQSGDLVIERRQSWVARCRVAGGYVGAPPLLGSCAQSAGWKGLDSVSEGSREITPVDSLPALDHLLGWIDRW